MLDLTPLFPTRPDPFVPYDLLSLFRFLTPLFRFVPVLCS
jgi:hypothetical protein